MKRNHLIGRMLAVAVMSASIWDAQMEAFSIKGQIRQRSELDKRAISSSSEARNSRAISNEIDISTSHNLENGVALTLGYSIFTPGVLTQDLEGRIPSPGAT